MSKKCPYEKKCGGCQYIDLPYEEQLKKKQKNTNKLLKSFGKVKPIIGMKDPWHYRNKVHGVVAGDRHGNCFTGIYENRSHRVIRVDSCLIENQKADEIMNTVTSLMKSFKMRPYNEDTGYGFLRHILVRTGYHTGQIMVVLVTASPVFPSKNNFVKALRKEHPEITTIIANVNNRNTSMVLGDKLKDVQATAIFREGVDMLDTIAMVFEGDRMATLQCGAREISDRMGSIFGTKGYIQVQNINNPEKITVFDKEHKEVAAYMPPAQITGYEYEVEACARAIAQGEKECPEMPHDETVRVMGIMDGIRKSWGYEIPLYE